jgi:iron complex outermembrane receptor protein
MFCFIAARFSHASYAASRGALLRALTLVCCIAVALRAASQTPAQTATNAPTDSSSSAPAQQKLPTVTTTVVVHGEAKDDYLPDTVTVGTLDGGTLQQAPLSATVVTRDLLTDQVARLLSDVVNNDASVANDYVPVGYYGFYQIRGFPLDLATGLEINGMTIAGEQDVPLENKQSVEFLKGLAGVESGVASAGGLIDYVTKRPAVVKDLDLATDHRGTAYGAVDLGHLFGSRKQIGARVNLAGERIASYMNDTNGWRAVGAGSADWKLGSRTILKGDFEYQHKTERDGSAYQLLGGTTVPDITKLYTSTMLGDQSWAPPDTYDTFNTGARLDYTLQRNWTAFAAASFSHSLIQDNVIYAYGSPFDDSGNVACPGAPDAPEYFFCPDGTYEIYDYRSPSELRIDAQAEAMVTGHVKTGAITHDLTVGGELFLRSVQLPGAKPLNAPDNVQDGAVYADIGTENIYQPIAPFPIEIDALTGTPDEAGPRQLSLDSHQSSLVMQDRIHLPGRFQLLAGGRFDSLRDHNYSAPTQTNPLNFTNRTVWLPQYAVTYNPVNNLTLYGNYGVMLSLGPQAPFWAGGYYLSPFFTRQAEVGAKYEPAQRILLTTAFFRMRAPFFYPIGNVDFESDGRETHDGIEVNAAGKATNWLRLTASAAATRAVSDESSTPTFNNKQVINVPHLRTTVFADIAMPRAHGLHLMPGWGYTGRKEATRDDLVSVSGYNLFSMGARYTPGGEQGRMTFRVYANNIADKRYWSDTGANGGDTFIWLGAPTTVRLSAHYTF